MWCKVGLSFLSGLAPRKAHVGHGDAFREVTLTSPPLSFICAACIIRLALVLSEERSREYIERSWLVSPGGFRDEKDSWKSLVFLWKFQRQNNCLWWLTEEKGASFTHTRGGESCLVMLTTCKHTGKRLGLESFGKNSGQEARLEGQSYQDRKIQRGVDPLEVRDW